MLSMVTRRRLIVSAIAVVLIACSFAIFYYGITSLGWFQSGHIGENENCNQRVLVVVAHQDDDLLFMNPAIQNDIRSGNCLRTVYVTAGDNRSPKSYWQAREDGEKAAYAKMAGVQNHWRFATLSVSGRQIALATLADAPRISLVFMRLPDNADGAEGTAILAQLWDTSADVIIQSVDGSSSYTKQDLIQTLAALMQQYHAQIIRTQDPTAQDPAVSLTPLSDHPDHIRVARLVDAASALYSTHHVVVHYFCDRLFFMPTNLSPQEIRDKTMIFETYVLGHDDLVCPPQGGIACFTDPRVPGYSANLYHSWLSREYIESTTP